MRITVFILIFSNLVLFLWQTQISPLQVESPLPQVPENKRLILLTEHEAKQRRPETQMGLAAASETVEFPELPDITLEAVATATGTQPPVTAEPQLSCYTIGPFQEISLARSVAARIGKLGASVQRRSKIEQEQYGYRVFLPPYATREEAIAAANQLVAHGIHDYFVISDVEQKNGISLGLFRKKSGAVRRMAQVRRFDFKPQMEIRYRDTTIYWLDYEQKGELVSDSVWREITETTPNVQRLPRDCPGKAE